MISGPCQFFRHRLSIQRVLQFPNKDIFTRFRAQQGMIKTKKNNSKIGYKDYFLFLAMWLINKELG